MEKYRVIHNDIHTGNIMRRTDGSYVLLDFGLAVDGDTDVVGSSRMQHGAIEFKSPERADGMEPTPQDDIYSFGCVLYAMLAGHPPFPIQLSGKEVSLGEQLRIYKAHKETPPPAIERDDIPRWLIDVTMRCLEKDPADRYADGLELYGEISKRLAEEKGVAGDNGVSADEMDKTIVELRRQVDELKESNSGLEASKKELELECETLKKSEGKRGRGWRIAFFVLLAAVIAGLFWQSRAPHINAYIYDDGGDYTNIRSAPGGFVVDTIPTAMGRFGFWVDAQEGKWLHIKDSKVYDLENNEVRRFGQDSWIHASIVRFSNVSRDTVAQESRQQVPNTPSTRNTDSNTPGISKAQQSGQQLNIKLEGRICNDKHARMTIVGDTGSYHFINYTRRIEVTKYDAATGELLLECFELRSPKYIGKFEGRLTTSSYSGKFTNYKGVGCAFNLNRD